MKVFSVFGISSSGKTTTIERIIQELKKRRYSVGSIKEIHYEKFAIDQEDSNTFRHKQAGAELVTARGFYETDILFPQRLPLEDILRFYSQDFVVIEGIDQGNFPKIITACTVNEIDERWDESVIAISGRIAEEIKEHREVPVINALTEIEKLVDLIEEKVFEKLPDFPEECCKACGYGCRELGIKILRGETSRSDCVISEDNVCLYFGGQKVEMVPFVRDLLRNLVIGFASELNGYKPGISIDIKIGHEL